MLSTAAALLFVAQVKAEADSVSAFIQGAFGTSNYKRADADLNGDGRKEVFAYLTAPDYCGSGGCTLVILSPRANDYRVVMRSTVTQLPIRVLPTSANGWRDVAVMVEGGGVTRPYEARLRFNGRRYPSNPTVQPSSPLRRASGTVLIDR